MTLDHYKLSVAGEEPDGSEHTGSVSNNTYTLAPFTQSAYRAPLLSTNNQRWRITLSNASAINCLMSWSREGNSTRGQVAEL